MPLYVYRCPTCSKEQELMRPMDKRDEPVTCPNQCAGEPPKRVVQGTSFVLNGGGWAKDGYS